MDHLNNYLFSDGTHLYLSAIKDGILSICGFIGSDVLKQVYLNESSASNIEYLNNYKKIGDVTLNTDITLPEKDSLIFYFNSNYYFSFGIVKEEKGIFKFQSYIFNEEISDAYSFYNYNLENFDDLYLEKVFGKIFDENFFNMIVDENVYFSKNITNKHILKIKDKITLLKVFL